MEKSRLEAFSDGVIAIIITIMVLEMKAPDGADWAALKPVVPVFLKLFVIVALVWLIPDRRIERVVVPRED